MKKKQFIYIVISGLVLISVILKGCNKPKPNPDYLSSTDYDPRVSVSVSSISTSSAILEGKITNTAYSTIQECIICWSTTENLIWFDNKVNNVKLDFSSFKDTLNGLVPNTIYYVGAVLKYTHTGSSIIGGDNSVAIQFLTLPLFPIILTSAIIEYTKYSAVVGGLVMNQGMTPVIERGLYLGLSHNPETSGTKTEMGNGPGGFSTKITGLSPNTN